MLPPRRSTGTALLAEGRRSGNPAEPLVRALVDRVGDEHARWVHLGATSQDVMDTAAMLVAGGRSSSCSRYVDRDAAACAALARARTGTRRWPGGRCSSRPCRRRSGSRLPAGSSACSTPARAFATCAVGSPAQLGGAAGTLAALGDRGPEVAALYAAELDLREPTLPWHANRVRIAELGAALEIAAGVLAKIALDLELLAQTEVGEVQRGRGRAARRRCRTSRTRSERSWPGPAPR